MPIDFIMVENSKRVNFHKGVSIGFPQKIEAYIKEFETDFPDDITILTTLDDTDDKKFSTDEIQRLYKLCRLILDMTEQTFDYKNYDKMKIHELKKEEFITFISAFLNMLDFAINNGQIIYSVGE